MVESFSGGVSSMVRLADSADAQSGFWRAVKIGSVSGKARTLERVASN